ncbi:MAG: type II secretion system F family protein [Clostridia bacterium]|nr:type II secretion system F family protein [Clostridia bacterium]
MPKYRCVAIDKDGKRDSRIRVEAPNKETVASVLKNKGYYIVSIREETIFDKEIEIGGNGSLPSKQVALFSKQFSMLLRAGISVSASLDILKDQLEDKRAKKAISAAYDEVLKGMSLSQAIASTKRFPDLFVNMVEAGEAGGFLDEVMERMSAYYEKDTKVVEQVRNSLIYPVVVIVVTIVVVYILVTQVVPQFVTMFDSMQVELPGSTKFLIALSDFLTKWWWAVFLGVGLGIFGLVKYVNTARGRYHKDNFLLHLPIFRSLVLKSIVARFTRTLSIMLKSGVPMIRSLELSSRIVSNKVIERDLMKVVDEVTSGKSLSGPMANMKRFPKMVISLMRTGEETGALDEMMEKCAEFYDMEVENLSARLTTLIEPMIILVLAGVVGFIVMSVLEPMFTMYNSLG